MKFIKYIFAYIIITFLFSSCDNKDCCAPSPWEHQFYMSVVDNKGNDLLNPTTQNHFKESTIRLYEIYGGDTTLVQKDQVDKNYGFIIYTPQGTGYDYYTFDIYFAYLPKWNNDRKEAKVLIKWDKDRSAILDAKFEKKGNTSSLTQIDYNGKKVWAADGTANYHFEVIEN